MLDDETGAQLDADLRARMRLLTRHPQQEQDSAEPAADPSDLAHLLTGLRPRNAGSDDDADEFDKGADSACSDHTGAGEQGWHLFGGAAGDEGFGHAGPGVPSLPVATARPAGSPLPPVEGSAEGIAQGLRKHHAFRMLLNDASQAAPGSGTPRLTRLTVIAGAGFITGQAGASPAQLDTGRGPVNLTPAALDRLSCHSLLSAVVLDARGTPIGASGEHRSATERERRALRAQWGTVCAVNGCGNTQTVPHHVYLWAMVHRTRLRDLIPICEPHHHDIHDQHRSVRLRDGRLVDETGWVDAHSVAA